RTVLQNQQRWEHFLGHVFGAEVSDESRVQSRNVSAANGIGDGKYLLGRRRRLWLAGRRSGSSTTTTREKDDGQGARQNCTNCFATKHELCTAFRCGDTGTHAKIASHGEAK